MSEQLRRVLAMLVDGQISVENAEQVIEALKTSPDGDDAWRRARRADPGTPRAVHIRMYHRPDHGRVEKDVTIRLPIAIVCGGMRLGMLIPGIGDRINARLRARGVDLDLGSINEEQIQSMLSRLGQLTIDVNQGGHHKRLRITCE